jgi:hypothetical protein
MIYLTNDMLEGLYVVISMTRPFRAWKLPQADDVIFHVTAADTPQGAYWYDKEKRQHHLSVSAKRHHTLHSAMMTLAHEMIHLHEKQIGVRDDVGHGWQFKRFAKQVCHHHGFDLGQF